MEINTHKSMPIATSLTVCLSQHSEIDYLCFPSKSVIVDFENWYCIMYKMQNYLCKMHFEFCINSNNAIGFRHMGNVGRAI